MYRLKAIAVSLMLLSLCMALLSGCRENANDNPSITIPPDEDNYAVVHVFPSENKTFDKDDEPPFFYWREQMGFPERVVLEIDYMNDGTYMSKTIEVGCTHQMTEEDWITIKDNAPVVDGLQKINWRIRIDYIVTPSRGAYYTDWCSFWIKNE